MRFLRWLDAKFEESIMVSLLSSLSIVMIVQIVMRYVFGNSLSWAEEFTRYCFIGMAAMSFSFSIRKRVILRIDIVLTLLPKAFQNFMNWAVYVVTLFFFGYVFYHSIFVIIRIEKSGQVSPALGFPMFLLYVALSLGFLLSIIRSVQVLVLMGKESAAEKKTGNKDFVPENEG